MKISVTHSTRYRYCGPVRLGLHILRLRPRHDGAQRLLCHELRIDPRPAVSTQATDQDGNVVAHAWFEEPASALEVESRFSVETLRENPFDFLVAVEPLLIAPAASGQVDLGPGVHRGAPRIACRLEFVTADEASG